MVLPLLTGFGGAVAAADFDPDAAHAKFVDAFNSRQWDAVKAQLAEDSVFHRANAGEVQSGPDAIVAHF
jgi:ketosteroid isomerase-like protein